MVAAAVGGGDFLNQVVWQRKKEKKKSNIEQDDSTIYALQIGISRRTPITFIIADGFYFFIVT